MAGPYVDGTKTDALMQDAALAPTPVADAPGLAPALASTGQEMRTGQPRARYGGRMNADGGLAWNAQNDQMMPGGTQIRESRTAYNDPLFGNTGQVLPHAHLANQLQGKKLERAKQRAEIKKKLENWDPTAGIPEVAPAYQEDLNKYVASQFEDAYRAAVDLNGGDEQAAQLALSNPNSAEGRAWKAIVDDATVVARKANFVTNDAIATMKAMDDGDAEYIPEVYEAADASLRAMKNGGNVRALANGMEQYQVVKEWNSFLKEKGIAEQLQKTDWSKETLNIPKGRDRNGMLVYETIGMGDPRMKDAIIRQTMMTVPPKYHKIYGEDGLYQRLERLLSANITSEAKIIDPYHAPTSEDAKPKSGYNFGNIGVTAGYAPETGNSKEVFGVPTASGGRLGSGLDPATGDVPILVPNEVTGDKTKHLGDREYVDASGSPHQLYGSVYKKVGNGWTVQGRELSAKETETITKELEKQGVPREDIPAEIEKRVNTQSLGALRSYPASKNMPFIEGYIGTSDLDGLWNSLQGGQQRTQAPAFTTDAPEGSRPPWEMYSKPAAQAEARPSAPAQQKKTVATTTPAAPKTEAPPVLAVKPITKVEPVVTKAQVADTLRAAPANVAPVPISTPVASASLDFFKNGRIVKSDMGGKKVYFIVQPGGMQTPLSTYFEDEESAKLVLDAFNRGEIYEQHLSKSRSVKDHFAKIRRERGE